MRLFSGEILKQDRWASNAYLYGKTAPLNNSDIIATLSLFLTGAIFLAQTNGALFSLKFRRREIIAGGSLLGILVVLVNSAVLERWGIQPYFAIGRFYLTPGEWALVIFLVLFSVILRRVFSERLFAEDSALILKLLRRYRADGDEQKSWYLLEQVLAAGPKTALLEALETEFFSNDHFIERTAAGRPYLLMAFRKQYAYSGLNSSRPLYAVLSGLFSSGGHAVFTEIEGYCHDQRYSEWLQELIFLDQGDLPTYPGQPLPEQWPILEWFAVVLSDMTGSLKDDVLYFLRFLNKPDERANTMLYSRDEAEIILKRDTVFNALRLFRIGIVQYLYTDPKKDQLIDRVLVVFYSAWEFLFDRTRLQNDGVQLNNDIYTLNEYLLKYHFESYVVVMIVQARIAEATPKHKIDEWPVKQLFSKLDGLLGSEGHVSMRSKQYYLTAIFDLYFEPDKLSESDAVQCWYRRVLLIYIKHGLKDSPYGKKILRLKAYQEALDNYDFVPFQQARGLVGEFYTALLPYTKDFEYNITGTVS